MSSSSTPATEAHYDYIRGHTAAEDPLLVELRSAARAAGIPPIQIAHEQARFLQVLLKAARAREVVEVGTLAGYSAIAMARALGQGGRVRTIEIDPARAAFAREWIAKSDVAGAVEVLVGPGARVLETIEPRSCDAVFIDADKANYPLYLEHSLRIARRGGLVLVDNAFAFGQLFHESPSDSDVPHVRAFNERMSRCAEVDPILVPMGDGLWVGVVR